MPRPEWIVRRLPCAVPSPLNSIWHARRAGTELGNRGITRKFRMRWVLRILYVAVNELALIRPLTSGIAVRVSPLSPSLSPPEHVRQHLLRQLSRRRILLARMIRTDQHRLPRRGLVFHVVPKTNGARALITPLPFKISR